MNRELSNSIERIVNKAGGNWSVVIQQFSESTPAVAIDPGKRFYAASVNKVVITLYLLFMVDSDEIELNERLSLNKKEKLPGTGILKYLDDGLNPTLHDLINLMLITSDNTAAKLIVNRFGVKNINAYLKSLGLEHTRLLVSTKNDNFSYGYTSAGEYSKIMTCIVNGSYLRKNTKEILLETMSHNHFSYGLARYFNNDISIRIANKEGTLDDLRHEVAIFDSPGRRNTCVVSVFSEKLDDKSYSVDNKGVLALAEMGGLIKSLLNN